MTGRLDPDDLAALTEAVAVRVVELLREDMRSEPTDALLTAAQVAERFRVDRGWVYDHARELQAVRLGAGPKARLRFDPAKVAAALDAFDVSKGSEPHAGAPQRRSRRRAPVEAAGAIPLLPIRGGAGGTS